jgi:hypothetical protein
MTSNSSMAGTLGPNSTSSSPSYGAPNSTSGMTSNSSMAGTLGPNSTSSSPSSGSLGPAGVNSTGSQNATGGNSIVFTETGLRTGWGACWPFWSCVPSWGVTHASQTTNATTDALSISAPSGEYSYSIVSPNGYTASPPTGKLMVNGNTNQTIHFAPNP